MNIALPKTPAEAAYDGIALPHRRMEDWRWTDLRQLVDRPYPPFVTAQAAERDILRLMQASPVARLARARLVFVNGSFDAGHSTMPASGGVTVGTGAPASLGEDDPVSAMNQALAKAGATIRIEGNEDAPIEILCLATAGEPRTIATRHRIDVAAGATATIVETHIGEGEYLSNAVTIVELAKDARLDRVKVEMESPKAIHLAHAIVSLGESTKLCEFTLTAGARVNRQDGTYRFEGKHAQAHISGSYLLRGKQHADTHLVVDHKVPCCTSRELFKCVMDDHARGIFQGKVIVRPDAQKTDGKQSSHGLLLSPTAEFDAKPELEIYADDVVCGHGATAGDLDENHLFYLRSRGIPEAQAKAMLVDAFVDEAFEAIGNAAIGEALGDFMHRRLRREP